ncbi:MAG: hypothetical protein ACNYPH_01060 [Gammaproteobacteria bacterium WSBS_2016_MAG_OTU1]
MTKESCQTQGCENQVAKPGYKYCQICWKNNHPTGAKTVAAKQTDSDNSAKQGTSAKAKNITATKIGEHFGINAKRVNTILNELGWIARDNKKEWIASGLGLKMGAKQQKTRDQKSYVTWSSSILENKIFCDAVADYLGQKKEAPASSATTTNTSDSDDFRKKFPANFRATDGHMVRSKAEMLVDNFLYTSGIVHAYERKLPVEEDVYCDFYLPEGKVYIEYWGLENEPKYLNRKKQKLQIYDKYKFNLIQLSEKEIENLDDHLPRLLLEFNITVD